MNKFICHQRKKFSYIWVLLYMAAAIPAYAAPPNSGTVLESAKPPMVRGPEGKIPEIIIKSEQVSAGTGSEQKIFVNAFRISGEPPVPTTELTKLVQSDAKKEITLGDLNKLATRITKYLRQKGYLVAFAYIPAQTIKDGIVEIAVVPGRYGQIMISGTAHIDKERLRCMLFAARSGSVISRRTLERELLLINDLSGVSVKTTLTPGQTTGTADLVLTVSDSAKINGAFYTDNWGNSDTGQTRYGTQVTVNNLSQNGNSLSLGGMTSGEGINNYNLGYSTFMGYDGAKFEIKHSRVNYTLGGDFADLDATGKADITSYDIIYPFVRSRGFSLYGTIGYENKHLLDDIGAVSHSPKSNDLWKFDLSGNFADTWLGGGENAFSVTYYHGQLSINDATALNNDTAGIHGDFSKTGLNYQRQQYVAKNLSFSFGFTGQLADKNLDSSEKIFLGGSDGVRAFPQGEASGDEGYKLTSEFRWRIPSFSVKNSLYLTTFYDYGSVMTNKLPYSTGVNRRSLMGAGLGLLWTRDQKLTIRMDYAWKIGQEHSTSNDKSGRLWVQGIKYF